MGENILRAASSFSRLSDFLGNGDYLRAVVEDVFDTDLNRVRMFQWHVVGYDGETLKSGDQIPLVNSSGENLSDAEVNAFRYLADALAAAIMAGIELPPIVAMVESIYRQELNPPISPEFKLRHFHVPARETPVLVFDGPDGSCLRVKPGVFSELVHRHSQDQDAGGDAEKPRPSAEGDQAADPEDEANSR